MMVAAMPTKRCNVGVRLGMIYFALIFARGFMLGVLRNRVFQAGVDESTRIVAVLIELPIMLGAS